ncbi:MAG: glycosyltransferase family 2 protein [Solirubrobacteraceae bacterium]|nr:glycosyltransferase family 2 protein [Solirubrobacteraceae bacterium]
MSFAICIVTHNSRRELATLLDSIDQQLTVRPQLICADSGSTDDSAALARERGAEVVVMDGNPGFGAANNAALTLVTEPVTVLLNPDCRLVDAGIERLAAAAADHRALIAPRLLNEDGSVQDSAHPLPGGRDAYLAALTVPRLLPRRLREQLQPFRGEHQLTVGWAIGACITARTQLLRELGPFSADDFLYAEDLDLCLRARALAIPTIFEPAVTLIHSGQHASRSMSDADRFNLQAARRREVIGDQLGPGAVARDDRSQELTFKLRALVGRDKGRNQLRLAALRKAQKRSS